MKNYWTHAAIGFLLGSWVVQIGLNRNQSAQIEKLNAQLIELDRRRENDWCEYENRLENSRNYYEQIMERNGQLIADTWSTADTALRIAEQANEE